MRKITTFYISIFFILMVKNLQAQQWTEVGGTNASTFSNYFWKICSDDSGNIYTSGAYNNSNSKKYVAKWNGSTWSELGAGGNALNANDEIYSVTIDDSGFVYAAGKFTNGNGKHYVAKWDGAKWSELGSGGNSLAANDYIWCVFADDSGYIYAGGNFTNNSGNRYLARWDGSNWSEVSGSDSLNANGFIYTIAQDDSGHIYVGGNFTNANGDRYVAKWNGTNWQEVGKGANSLNANGGTYCIVIDKNFNIYTGGYFTNASSYWYVAKWNGSKWIELGTGANALNALGEILDMKIDTSGNIYAGGWFANSNGNYYIAKWNGTKWSELGGANTLKANNLITGLTIDPLGKIYTAGRFTNGNNKYYVAAYGCTAPKAPKGNNSNGALNICIGNTTKLQASGTGKISWYTDSVGGQFLYSGTNYTTSVLTQTTTFYAQDSTCAASNKRTAITVMVNPYPIVNFTQHDISCFGDSTGDIQINASGTGSIHYSWSPSVSTTSYASHLNAANYTCIITDSFHCPVGKTIAISQSPAIISTIHHLNPKCNGDSAGTANISASGGKGNLNYVWSPYGGNDSVANALKAGTYICIITDSNSCTRYDTVIITDPAAINIQIVSQNDILCHGDSNGSVTLNATGGTGNLDYDWSPNGGNNSTASGLLAGKYICTVTDAAMCKNAQTFTILEPTAIAANIASQTNASCHGQSDGTVIISATGGIGALKYSWSPNVGNAPSVSGLMAGNYICTVTDSNNCSIAKQVNITEPQALLTTVALVGQILTADASATSYQWLDCTNNYSKIVGATKQTYSPAANGDYAVEITISNCSDTSACVTVSSIGLANVTLSGAEGLVIYPNPNNGSFIIQSAIKETYSIINELGQIIQVFQLNDANNYTEHIAHLGSGVYCIVGLHSKQMQKVVVLR